MSGTSHFSSDFRHRTKQFSLPGETLLVALLETSPDVVYFKNRESRFVAVSASLVRKHGLGNPDDVIGKTDFDFFEESFARRGFDEEQKIVATGVPLLNVLVKETWSDGQRTWSLNSKSPLRDNSGKILGIVGIGRDVTETKEMEHALDKARQDLLHASRLAGMAEVATGVLHNVGNVLNSLNVSTSVIAAGLRQLKIEGLEKLCSLLQQHGSDLGAFFTADPHGRRVPEYLARVTAQLAEERARLSNEVASAQKNVDHIKEIVSMQQAHARMGGLLEPLDPASLIEDALRISMGSLTRHDVRVVQEYRDARKICAERGKVLQILVNLIGNAKQACSAREDGDRTIELRIEPGDAERVRLIVEDNGEGISAENLPRIFVHGFTTKIGGHGFGLHSSALAAQEMKGTLTVHSDGPGRGARFVLELPAAREEPAAGQSPSEG